MKKLIDLQNNFIDGIYNKPSKDLLLLIEDGKASKKELLDIYRNNLYSNLTNAIRITYPKVYEFLKEKKFAIFCKEFIKKQRSNSGNLDDYGEEFVKFLRRKKEYFLSDLAKLEWLQHQAYLAKDAAGIKIEKLQKLDQEKLFNIKFKLHPSCYLLASNYNLLGKTNQKKSLKNPTYFLIYRHDLEIKSTKISKNEFDFLNGIKANLTLYKIYQKYQIDISKPLQNYLANGVICEFLLT